MYVVIQTDAAASDRFAEHEAFAASGLDVEFRRCQCSGEDDVLRECADADAIIPAYVSLSASVLNGLEKCRVVAVLATGHGNVDTMAATELGIAVTHVPDYCTMEVADHTLGLLLDVARNISSLHRSVRQGAWDYEAAGRPERLAGRTLGLVGFGRIGRAVALRARAFGLSVLTCDPYVDESTIEELGASKVDLDAVLSCDYVSLHCSLTGETRGMIDAAALARMKPTTYLLNTARGACVDTSALVDALDRGVIAGAGLDVVDPEPLPPGHPLRRMPNVVLTPHSAFLSRQAEREAWEKVCGQVRAALRGEAPAWLVNPEVLERANCRLRAGVGG